MAHRETTVTVYGTTRTIRTERTGTARQLETRHTRAVKAALKELHEAGKDAALAAAKKTARAADRAVLKRHCAPTVIAAQDAHRAVKRIEKRTWTGYTFPDLDAMRAPFQAPKFDLDPTDALFADCHDFIDPDAPAKQPPTVEEPRPLMGGKAFLDSLLAAHQSPAPAVEEPAEDMDLEEFLNDFFAPAP
ncbi:hypothetical protein ACFRQM_09370 [Streptomyces sp. NPDC056831]|uniref:hypothetical protein n=1 Tax=Streptomyces sp. NPDC056831 TaxID=3345954 RepID=UPI0036C020B5